MRLPFQSAAPKTALRKPAPSATPELHGATVAAVFCGQRVSGDYYEFLKTGERLVVVLLDIAGRRDEAFDIEAEVQTELRARVPALFGGSDINESSALTELLIEVNRAILRAANGVRCAPAFLACYHEALGTVTYINAGYLPALLRDTDGISLLSASGLPLGLFTHTTQDAAFCALRPGTALLLASRGLLESRRRNDDFNFERLRDPFARGEEFGLERVKESLARAPLFDAKGVCAAVINDVRAFTGSGQLEDDVTSLALVRSKNR